jgi:hypothetical protein
MRCIKSAVENFIEPRLLKKGSGLVLGMVFRAAPFDTEQTSYKRIDTVKAIDDVLLSTLSRKSGDDAPTAKIHRHQSIKDRSPLPCQNPFWWSLMTTG